jgi:hypothetical protein
VCSTPRRLARVLAARSARSGGFAAKASGRGYGLGDRDPDDPLPF